MQTHEYWIYFRRQSLEMDLSRVEIKIKHFFRQNINTVPDLPKLICMRKKKLTNKKHRIEMRKKWHNLSKPNHLLQHNPLPVVPSAITAIWTILWIATNLSERSITQLQAESHIHSPTRTIEVFFFSLFFFVSSFFFYIKKVCIRIADY